MRGERVLRRVMQRYWRWQRALTLGARGMVVDADGRFLLVRHTYTPGWTFPGGGVEYAETIEDALRRELSEEANIELTGPVELFGVYSNWAIYPGDHVALYVVRQWHQPKPPPPSREIAEVAFFGSDSLPHDTTEGTRRRIDEFFGKMPRSEHW